MHMYGISNSSATFLPNLASLVHMVQEILDKIGQSIKNTKVSLFKLVRTWHCMYKQLKRSELKMIKDVYINSIHVQQLYKNNALTQCLYTTGSIIEPELVR